ncbi:MAG: CHAT domain-containing protein [Scytonema sp. PMC 1069.18]|nr:CHAT domain-containing protein [Scytonema sp. PMC 1069.18]
MAVNPRNTPQLRLDEEVRDIVEALQRAPKREQFKLQVRWAVRLKDFYRAMLDTQPQIVHFCGHGAGVDGLVLEDETGQAELLQAETLSSIFEPFAIKGVECVLLNGCYSKLQAEAISQYVNYAIGMNCTIGDRAAINFAVAFYDALGSGEEIEFAFKLGRSQLVGLKKYEIPVLIKKPTITQAKPSFISFKEYNSLSVKGGLDALKELMTVPEVRDAVVAFRNDFQTVCEQIGVLGNYKDLHDRLHQLEFLCYGVILQEAKRFPNDDTALYNLMEYQITLERIVDQVREVAIQRMLASDQTTWVKDLELAHEELQGAIKNSNTRQLEKSVWLINRVLAIQPSRINTSLNTAARSLRLPALVKAMSGLGNQLQNSQLEQKKTSQFQEGVNALVTLSDALTVLVKNHNDWQEMDLELRRIEANFERDAFELEMSWPHLKAMAESLCGSNIEEWALSFQKDGDNLDKAIAAQDPVKVKRLFRCYRRRAGERFYRIDMELKRLCGNLRIVGEPLASIVMMIS